jgi:hypothetical protein
MNPFGVLRTADDILWSRFLASTRNAVRRTMYGFVFPASLTLNAERSTVYGPFVRVRMILRCPIVS